MWLNINLPLNTEIYKVSMVIRLIFEEIPKSGYRFPLKGL
jgi:hypothetical protein